MRYMNLILTLQLSSSSLREQQLLIINPKSTVFNMLTGLYLSRPVVYSGISVRYLFKSIPPINLSNVPADPNNLKETVVNILVLDYYNLQLKFSSQVNFNIKEDLSFILNERSSFSVETVISQPLLTFRHYCTQVSKQSIVIMQSCMHLYLVFPQSTVYTLISSTVSSAGFVLFSSIHNTSRTFIHIILVPNHFRHISCLFYYFSQLDTTFLFFIFSSKIKETIDYARNSLLIFTINYVMPYFILPQYLR